ncbi:MAG TPA: anthranilate phosphoribosyltransferase [Vicinamibacterales bacterium]|nr:anthranilate phosphoribosyltransferase [Vicinamibacterales bacterium]
MFAPLLEKLHRREDLTAEEASAAMAEIMDGRAQPAQIAGFLVALGMKGERPSEIVGLARAMRARATKLSRTFAPVFDTCGTGGDRAHTFNVSTLSALVLAAAGIRVAKHGNRSVSSRCGSADLLEALGVNIAAPPEVVERCLDQAGIAFFFAPTFHPSMRHAAPARKELGIRTAFNLLGPLTNPAGAARQLVGVPRPELTELVARSLALLGAERAWVVHGADGLDEISTTGYTKVSECRAGAVNTFYVHPSDFKLPKAAPADLRGGDASDNAAIARRVLDGEPGPARDIVLLNAAVSLLIAGAVTTVPEGMARAAMAIDSGAARGALDRLTTVSNAGAPART